MSNLAFICKENNNLRGNKGKYHGGNYCNCQNIIFLRTEKAIQEIKVGNDTGKVCCISKVGKGNTRDKTWKLHSAYNMST